MKRNSVPANVFISSGVAFTNTQELFMQFLENLISHNDLCPLKIGHAHPSDRPISMVKRVLGTCDGAIIVAFTRFEIKKGIEFPESKREKSIDGIRLPTTWNQLEGGMAYALEIPVLILMEKGLDRQGILGDVGEEALLEIELSASTLEKQAFRDVFWTWRELVMARASTRRKKYTLNYFSGDRR